MTSAAALDDYARLVGAKVAVGDTAWLERELLERMRVNLGLITENLELRRQLTARPAPALPDLPPGLPPGTAEVVALVMRIGQGDQGALQEYLRRMSGG